MNYDIAAGMDNPTLNVVVAQVYKALYPNLLKNSINVGAVGISSVAFDINAAPTVDLAPSAAAKAYFEDAIATNKYGATGNLDEDSKQVLLNLADAASFNVAIPSIALTINYTSGAQPTTVNGSVAGAITIQAINQSGQNLLTVQLMSATISIPADPDMAGLLNNAFVPLLIPYLNAKVLDPIQIPALQYKSLQVSMPLPVVAAPYLTAYSALGATQPDIPGAYNWPTGCVYIALDVAAMQAAAGIIFPLGPSTGFNWDIISGEVGAQVLGPNPIFINPDGSLTATMVANASAQLTLHTPNWLPNVSFGPSATATLTGILLPSVNNGELELSIEGVPIPTFSFDWGIPSWINWLFDPIEDALAAALNAVLQPLLSQVLTFPPIPILSLPTISFNFEGTQISINIVNATPSGQNSLLLISAQATVS